jgi:hypothetical protein
MQSSGVVIVFHCVPFSVDPKIEQFWGRLRLRLKKSSYELVLITTTEILDKTIPHIEVPYIWPLDGCFYNSDEIIGPDANTVLTLSTWYGLKKNDAVSTWKKAHSYFSELLSQLEPAAVISWQSTNPISRIVRQLCLSQGIPWMTSERGWTINTLMFDLNENNYHTELTNSLILNEVYRSYKVNLVLLEKHRRYTKELENVERYLVHEEPNHKKHRWGIPDDSTIFALFTHGEPHVQALAGERNFQQNHGLTPGQLQEYVEILSSYLAKNNSYLLIKEHPFNLINGHCLDIKDLPNVFMVTDTINDILNSVDYCLFTLSTLQFDIALKFNTPFGLLSRGILSDINAAPYIGDFDDVAQFINEFTNPKLWNPRKLQIDRKISFLIEFVLLNIDDNSMDISIEKLALHLEKFKGNTQDIIQDSHSYAEVIKINKD